MSGYHLSKRADADIAGIADFTIKKFGIKQARIYRDGLEASFRKLAKDPQRGRSAGHLAPGLRRLNFESHVIFFLSDEYGTLIVRVLHQRMAFEQHSMTSDE